MKKMFAGLSIAVLCTGVFMASSLPAFGQENPDPKALTEDVRRLQERVDQLEQQSAGDKTLAGWSEKIAIHGVLAGAYQYESISGPATAESVGRGAVPLKVDVSITPSDADEVFFSLGFTAGKGLSGVTALSLSPWAANMEDDVKSINGRNRDYLLTAGYKHTFTLGDDASLGVTGGIIDATGYLDQNAYANDEYTQFMNTALVNGPHGFAPSYDLGGAVELGYGPMYVNGVVMDVGKNDDGNNYTFYGMEIGYTLSTPLGEGTYRVVYEGGSEAFMNPAGTALERRQALFLSFDQQVAEGWGVWMRLGAQTTDAAVNYADIYTGGVDIKGGLWGR
ncbi:MAG: hypothetical protein ABIL58_22820, partial [Pseudomonadota bacterium]